MGSQCYYNRRHECMAGSSCEFTEYVYLALSALLSHSFADRGLRQRCSIWKAVLMDNSPIILAVPIVGGYFELQIPGIRRRAI